MRNLLICIVIVSFTCFCSFEKRKSQGGGNDTEKRSSTVDDDVSTTVFDKQFIGKDFASFSDVSLNYEKAVGKRLKLNVVSRFVRDFDQHFGVDTITFEKIVDWNDPGDFHKVQVILRNHSPLSVFNSTGWVKLVGSTEQKLDEVESENIHIDNELVTAEITEGEYLIFLFGYIYANDPGYLSIISIKDGYDPKFVINLQCYLMDVLDLNNDGRKDLVISTDYQRENLHAFEVNLWLKENQELVRKYRDTL